MKPRWLLVLVWMLALALPLQGLAAASRLMCHHAQAAFVAAAVEAAPCHGDAAPADPVAHPGCIACAACHGMAALPSSLPVLLPELPSQAPAAAAVPLVLPYITAGPERPPRTVRA